MSWRDDFDIYCKNNDLDPDKAASRRQWERSTARGSERDGKHGSRRANGHDKAEAPEPKLFDDAAFGLTSNGFKEAATYRYQAATGDLLYEVVRFEHSLVKGAKEFLVRRPSANSYVISLAGQGRLKVIYNWPEVAKRSTEPVHFTEGEKDADRLKKLGFVATTVAGGNWSSEAATALAGRDVLVYEDNDAEGRKRATEAAEWLHGTGARVRIVRLPGLSPKQDVSDWLDKGHSIDELKALGDTAPEWGVRATPYAFLDPTTIPRRSWLYRPHYIRQFVSLTVSTGGVGKSSLIIAEALAMASSKPLLRYRNSEPLRVWYWNGEDPLDELHRRIAAASKHFGLTTEDIGDRLFVDSGRTRPIVIAEDVRRETRVTEPVIFDLISTIRDRRIDVLIIDPFVTSHRVNENDNAAIERVVKAWSHIAEEANCSIMLVHHSRKVGSEGITVDDGRGASALLAAARSARTLNTMSAAEARDAEIEEGKRRYFFRSDSGKLNLAPPPEEAEWYRLVSVDLGNAHGRVDWDEGDRVGVVVAWEFPKVAAPRLTQFDVRRAQDLIAAAGPWREDQRSPDWVGIPIAKALNMDMSSLVAKRAVRKIAREWIEEGWLTVFEDLDARRTRRTFVEVGNLAGEGSAPQSQNRGAETEG